MLRRTFRDYSLTLDRLNRFLSKQSKTKRNNKNNRINLILGIHENSSD